MDLEEGEIDTEGEESHEEPVISAFSTSSGFWSRPTLSTSSRQKSGSDFRGRYRVEPYKRRQTRNRERFFGPRNFQPPFRQFNNRARQELTREDVLRDMESKRESFWTPLEADRRISARRWGSPEDQRNRTTEEEYLYRPSYTPDLIHCNYPNRKQAAWYDESSNIEADDYSYLVERHRMIQRELREYDNQVGTLNILQDRTQQPSDVYDATFIKDASRGSRGNMYKTEFQSPSALNSENLSVSENRDLSFPNESDQTNTYMHMNSGKESLTNENNSREKGELPKDFYNDSQQLSYLKSGENMMLDRERQFIHLMRQKYVASNETDSNYYPYHIAPTAFNQTDTVRKPDIYSRFNDDKFQEARSLASTQYVSQPSSTELAQTTDSATASESKKKKKKSRLKKGGKKKRKVKMLNELISLDGTPVKTRTRARMRSASMENSLSVDSLLSSCRQESETVYSKHYHGIDTTDDYNSVAMDLCGYSSEDKVLSPSIGKESKDYFEDISDEEIDEQVLREEVLRSMVAKRMKKSQELLIKDPDSSKELEGKETIETVDKSKDLGRKPLHVTERSINRKVGEDKQLAPARVEEHQSPTPQKATFVPFKVKSQTKKVIKYDKDEDMVKSDNVDTEDSQDGSCISEVRDTAITESTLDSTDMRKKVVATSVPDSVERRVPATVRKLPMQSLATSTKVIAKGSKQASFVTKPLKKTDLSAIALPKHDPLVIQVGGESDSDDDDAEKETNFVDSYLEEIKGELQRVGSPSSSVGSPRTADARKDNNNSETNILNDNLLFELQSCIQESALKVKMCSSEHVTDRNRLANLFTEVQSKKNKIEEQETKIAKLLKQLLAARKLKKIFMKSLEDSEQKVKLLKEQQEMKQFRLKALERESVKGEKVLSLAKKELLKQRLQKMRLGDGSSPTSDSSPRASDGEEKSSTVVQDQQHLRKNRLISTHIQNISNRLTFLINNLSKVQGNLEPKGVVKRRKSSEGHLAVVSSNIRAKAKINTIRTTLMSKSTATHSNTPLRPAEVEKARLIRLEKELRDKIAQYQFKSNRRTPTKTLPTAKADQLPKQENALLPQVKNLNEALEETQEKGPPDVSPTCPEDESNYTFLHDSEKVDKIQRIYDERIMSSRISANANDTILLKRGNHRCPTFDYVMTDPKFGTVQREQAPSDCETETIPSLPYRSTLLMFKAYRLCPFFRSKANLRLSSCTFSNKVDPKSVVCPFDLHGKCLDESCKRQHGSIVFSMTFRELLDDLLSYDTQQRLISSHGKTDRDKDSYVESFLHQYQGKISDDEIIVLLLNEIRVALKSPEVPKGYDVAFCRPTAKTVTEETLDSSGKDLSNENSRIDRAGSSVRLYDVDMHRRTRKVRLFGELNYELAESQEVRYFAESYNCVEELEKVVQEKPHETSLWISLCQFYLQQSSDTESSGDWTNKALNALSRGLDQNPHSEDLWLYYLRLFGDTRSYEEVQSTCFKAVQCVRSFKIHWTCLEILRFYTDKKQLCQNLIATLSESFDKDTVVDEETSGYVTETLMYLISMTIQCGKARLASDYLAQALQTPNVETVSLPSVTQLLTCCDRSFLWLVRIYLWEFGELPPIFDSKNGNLSRIVSRDIQGLPFSSDQPLPSKKTQRYFEGAMSGVLMCHKPCDKVCLSLTRSYLHHEMLYSNKEDFIDLLNRMDHQFRLFPDFCAINFTHRASLLTHQATVDIGRDMVTSSCFNSEMVYTYCKWLVKTRRKTTAVNTIVEFIRSKFHMESSQLDLPNDILTIALFKRCLGVSVSTLGQLPQMQIQYNHDSKGYFYTWLTYWYYTFLNLKSLL